jgi:hypothetical protein
MSEQLVWIQVDPAVKAVVIIEVPVTHQDFEVLQCLQRLLALILETIHRRVPLAPLHQAALR